MTSIQTNRAAMSSLQGLAATQRDLMRVQSQVSSGLAVAVAADNAAYWTVGQQMRAQISGLDAVGQGLALTRSIADVTAAALVAIKGSLDKIQDDVVTARQSGIDRSALQADIAAQQQSILAVANGASFNGVNWLIDRTEIDQTVTASWVVDVSENDDFLLRNLRESGIEHYTGHGTIVTTVVDGGTAVASQTETYGGQGSLDTRSGSGVITGTPGPDVTTGDLGPAPPKQVILPVSQSATRGVLTTTLPLAPLSLFTDNTGTTKVDVTRQYADKTVVEPEVTTTSTTHSYDTSFPAQSGILDGAIPTSNSWAAKQTLLNLDITAASTDDLEIIGQAVQAALAGLKTASTDVGALQTQVATQQSYNSALADSLASGLGSLVDADMNVASTRLQALQTRQQLGLQALSIANADSRLVLKLFGAA